MKLCRIEIYKKSSFTAMLQILIQADGNVNTFLILVVTKSQPGLPWRILHVQTRSRRNTF